MIYHSILGITSFYSAKLCGCLDAAISGVITQRAAASDFKDAAKLRFGHSVEAFDLFIETSFLHIITLLSKFSIIFSFSGIPGPK